MREMQIKNEGSGELEGVKDEMESNIKGDWERNGERQTE